MQFKYTARDTAGKETTGTIEAESKLAAADKLFNEERLTVVNLDKISTETEKDTAKPPKDKKPALVEDEKKTRLHIGKAEEKVIINDSKPDKKIQSLHDLGAAIDDYLMEYTKISVKEKVIFFRLLAVMINAGLPIVKSLKILSRQGDNKRFQKMLMDVAETVESGESFSSALTEYDTVFNESEIGVIASGEASGQLNQILTDLANESEKSAALKSKIKGAMIYPAVILIILVLVTIVVMTAVIPKLADLFLGAGVELPATTMFLINTSNWFVDSTLFVPNWLVFILAIFGTFFAIKTWKRTTSGKMLWDRLMLKLPLFGKELHMKIALADFTRQLSTLTASGISIVRALDISADAVSNEVYRQRIRDIREDVEQGVPINESIANDTSVFPDLVVSMIAVGEQTAQLGEVTKKIASFYEEEVDRFVDNLSKIMEPVIIVVVGLMVAGLVMAIMQPIMSIADVAASQ